MLQNPFRPVPDEPVPDVRIRGGPLLQPPLRGDQHEGDPEPNVRGLPQGCQLHLSQVRNGGTAYKCVFFNLG